MEDCCAVCAEPLDWTAYGPCGHTEACSKCVTRLRFALDDKRCVICQQQLPVVFVTRYMGDYTFTIPAQQFAELQGRSGLCHLPAVEAYFDDEAHYDSIRALCSYTHPELGEGEGRRPCRSLRELKQLLAAARQLHFCDICLDSRKASPARHAVFIPEQQLYTKQELDRHLKSGDTAGPLAESGFKGHPQCRFCRKRFYGDSELFLHMQSAHEQCFLCRRARPERYVYYRDYPELEEHFRHEHWLCEDADCLAKKFIVFASEQEFRQHSAREHAGAMSRAEKRHALTIPVNFQYRRDEGAASAGAGASHQAGGGAAGITIGGAGAVRSRFGRRPENDGRQLHSALNASMESAQTEHALRASAAANGGIAQGSEPGTSASGPSAREEAPEQEPPLVTGRAHWAAAAGSSGAAVMRPEDFPALPVTSKSAKRREKDKTKQRTLAEQLGTQTNVRVLHAGGGGKRSASQLALSAPDDFPTLSHSTSTPDLQTAGSAEPEWQEVPAPPQRQVAQQQRLTALQRKAAARAAAAAANPFTALPMPLTPPPPSGAAAAAGPSSRGPSPNRPATPQPPPSLPKGPAPQPLWGPSAGKQGALQPAQAQPPVSREQAFPALGGQPGAGPRSAPGQYAAVPDSAKAANKALMEEVRARVDQAGLDAFRREAAAYMRGETDAATYCGTVASLGLGSLVPDMAALLPDPAKGAALLSVHSAASSGQRPDSGAAPSGAPGTEAFPALGGPSNGTAAAGKSSRAQGKKGAKKVPKFERLRLTGGDPEAMQAWMDTGGGTRAPTKPQNAWSQGQPSAGSGGPGAQLRGQWSKQGKLAKEWGGINEAWDKM